MKSNQKGPSNGKLFTEEDWNVESKCDKAGAYSHSKVGGNWWMWEMCMGGASPPASPQQLAGCMPQGLKPSCRTRSQPCCVFHGNLTAPA